MVMTPLATDLSYFSDMNVRRYPLTARISPLYRKFGDPLVDVFSRPVVQDRVAGQSLEARVASSRLAAGRRRPGEVVGKRRVGR